MKLKDLTTKLEQRLPLALQEKWDHCGLNLGDPEQSVTSVLFSYDICREVIAYAKKKKHQLIISHHPFRMSAKVNLRLDEYEGQLIRDCIKQDIALYSCHTNHDASRDSLNFYYLNKLGATNLKPLSTLSNQLYKLAVYTPQAHSKTVLNALFGAGAGSIGAYDECSFKVSGTGSFRGDDSTHPAIGQKGRREEVLEDKLEVIVANYQLKSVLAALFKSHPYEEVAYDLIPIENKITNLGLGAYGELKKNCTLPELAAKIKRVFEVKNIRLVNASSNKISRIGICTGSGSSLLDLAIKLKLDAFLTGDVKYHQAIEAKRHDVNLIDMGHFHSEKHSVHVLRTILQELFGPSLRSEIYPNLKDAFEFS